MQVWAKQTQSGCIKLGVNANPQQDDLRLSGPPSGPGASSEARTCNRRVPADLSADSLTTVPLTPPPLHG
ncbi:hypothetical protein PoB_007026300 [Plakobranchus ocellatus]|uniref:Uncharacterized protein n=1 Tax=Plakobranchus ocellatus TaxID=259542 RepID=A0AAV4DHJ5_9GAST|nr:hypothetical protein PoB_007026300 [Plakobranchus ocellatus]